MRNAGLCISNIKILVFYNYFRYFFSFCRWFKGKIILTFIPFNLEISIIMEIILSFFNRYNVFMEGIISTTLFMDDLKRFWYFFKIWTGLDITSIISGPTPSSNSLIFFIADIALFKRVSNKLWYCWMIPLALL